MEIWQIVLLCIGSFIVGGFIVFILFSYIIGFIVDPLLNSFFGGMLGKRDDHSKKR